MDPSTVTCSMSLFVMLGVSGLYFTLFFFLWKMLVAKNVGPDQTPHYVASDLGLLCLPWTLLQGSRSDWVKILVFIVIIPPAFMPRGI